MAGRDIRAATLVVRDFGLWVAPQPVARSTALAEALPGRSKVDQGGQSTLKRVSLPRSLSAHLVSTGRPVSAASHEPGLAKPGKVTVDIATTAGELGRTAPWLLPAVGQRGWVHQYWRVSAKVEVCGIGRQAFNNGSSRGCMWSGLT